MACLFDDVALLHFQLECYLRKKASYKGYFYLKHRLSSWLQVIILCHFVVITRCSKLMSMHFPLINKHHFIQVQPAVVASDSFDIFGDDDEDLPATSRLGETVKEDNAGAQNGGLAELPGYVYDESSGYEDSCITLENLGLSNLLVCVTCLYDSTGVRRNTLCIGFWRNVI